MKRLFFKLVAFTSIAVFIAAGFILLWIIIGMTVVAQASANKGQTDFSVRVFYDGQWFSLGPEIREGMPELICFSPTPMVHNGTTEATCIPLQNHTIVTDDVKKQQEEKPKDYDDYGCPEDDQPIIGGACIPTNY